MEDILKAQIKLPDMKTIMFKVKNTLDGTNDKLDNAEKKTGEFEKTEQSELSEMKYRENDFKKENSNSELWDNLKWSNICVT